MECETSKSPYKPFFTLYAKKRNWFNLMRFIFGEYKFKWFEKDKQPIKYKNAFELAADSIDLDTKDINLTPQPTIKKLYDQKTNPGRNRN